MVVVVGVKGCTIVFLLYVQGVSVKCSQNFEVMFVEKLGENGLTND